MTTAAKGNVLIVGFATTGQAVARVLRDEASALFAIDDVSRSSAAGRRLSEAASRLGVELSCAPGEARLGELARTCDLVVLSPGVSPRHRIFGLVEPGRIVAEIELGAEIAGRAGIALVAITGTNGKTTVTSLVTKMLVSSGVAAVAAGNIGDPLVEVAAGLAAGEHPAGEPRRVVVAEASSFQLAWTKSFRPSVACWLNFAPDHLDWHASLSDYAGAKARIWQNQVDGDLAVANAEDPVVLRASKAARGSVVTFGLREGSFREEGGYLLSDQGEKIAAVAELPRRLPHDRANALAAAACALPAGAHLEGCRSALATGVSLRHRIELVATADEVAYYDDSKATTPAAVCAALAGFDSVVLIAGGRSKGLDLGSIVDFLAAARRPGGERRAARLRGVVAIGEAAEEVADAFSRVAPVVRASSMDEAVKAAIGFAMKGDAVLLSPGYASFDWYGSYGERGDDFARVVERHLGHGSRDAGGGGETPGAGSSPGGGRRA